MIRLVAITLLALAVGFGMRDVLQPTSGPIAGRTSADASEAQVTLSAPGLL